MPLSRQILTEGPSKPEEATRAQDDQLKKEDPPVVIIQVPDGEEIGLSSNVIGTFRSLDEALQNQRKSAATPLIRKVTYMNKAFLEYFKPSAIAIGPLHHDDPDLQSGEKLKLKLAAHFIKKSGSTKRAFYDKIETEMENLKKCYDPKELMKYDDEKLTLMLLVDGCAVLYLLHNLYSDDADKLEIRGDILAVARRDLIKLENQLPYQLIETLISKTSKQQGGKLNESIRRFIDESTMTLAERDKKEKIQRNLPQQQTPQEVKKQEHPAHLLELFRSGLLDLTPRYNHGMGKVWRSIASPLSRYRHTSHHFYTFHNIRELKGRGVLLRPSKTSSLKDVSFHCSIFTGFRGVLRLPPLTLDECAVTRFMNLIAYEMCRDFENKFDISSYIFFLDSLIDQAEDVKELRDSGILHNRWRSDEEVANLFNKMGPETVENLDLYQKVKARIQSHCNNRFYTLWYTFFAEAHRIYFSSPWAVIALLGAVAALALSATQAYYTIHPTSQRN